MMPGPARSDRLLQSIDRLSTWGMLAAGISALIMTALVTAEVLLRSVAGVSTLIADEWAAYLLVAIAFLGLGYTAKSGGFVQVELVVSHLGPRLQRGFQRGNLVAAALVGAILDYWLFRQTVQSFKFDVTSNFLSRTPLWIPQALAVLGITLFVLQVLAQMPGTPDTEPGFPDPEER